MSNPSDTCFTCTSYGFTTSTAPHIDEVGGEWERERVDVREDVNVDVDGEGQAEDVDVDVGEGQGEHGDVSSDTDIDGEGQRDTDVAGEEEDTQDGRIPIGWEDTRNIPSLLSCERNF
ncbi:hypothetical protein HDV00_005988 [Rhizophlyctis rosea]|nr:hypothetical protein HDV00_005988 [Rhizophlyctis rosea]